MSELKFDCKICTGAQKRERGCIEKSNVPVFDLDGEQFFSCPIKMITDRTSKFLRFFKFYKDGFLPNQGGILEQPKMFLDAIQIIDSELNDIIEHRERNI